MADNREKDQTTNYQRKIESLFSDEREKPVEEDEIDFDELDKYLADLKRKDPSVSQNHGLPANNSGSKSKNTLESFGNSSNRPNNNNNNGDNKKRKSKKTTTVDRDELGSGTRAIVIDGDDGPIYKCRVCGKTYVTRQQVGSHWKVHTNEAKRRGLRIDEI